MYSRILADVVKELCNSQGYYELHWNEEENLDESLIAEAVSQTDCDPRSYISEMLLCYQEDNVDSIMYNAVSDRVYNSGDNSVIEAFESSDSVFEDLWDAGYRGVEIYIENVLKCTKINVRIGIATESELNYDMNSIMGAYGCKALSNPSEAAKYSDNAVTYLIKQQGYSLKDFYYKLSNSSDISPNSDSFIDSVVNEIENSCTDNMSELCILVRMNAAEYLDLLSGKKNIRFRKDSTVGIFNELAGCGGPFGIKMDRDLILPPELIKSASIDMPRKNGNYSIIDVYGKNVKWNHTLSFTDDPVNSLE